MTEHEHVDWEEFDGSESDEAGNLSRRDLFVKGGLLTAGAAFLGPPVAAAKAAARAPAAADAAYSFAVVTHGAGDAFWAVVKKGVLKAGKDLGVRVSYSESFNNPQKQAQLIGTAVARKPGGIVVSAPNPSALKDALRRARNAGIPIITINSGVQAFKSLGALTHVGQTETIAGRGAGAKLKAAGTKHLLVVIHEQGNIGLEQRYSGAKSGFKGKTSRLQVKGVTDISTTTNQIRTKLRADRSIDAILALNPQVGVAAKDAASGAGSKAKIATFDLSSDVIKAIQRGQMLFAVDQQQYEQGYLPIVFLYLYKYNLNTVGGGQPVLTGPGYVEKRNASKVAAYARRGTR
jgi:simple sugar transport system substrate-binding protein